MRVSRPAILIPHHFPRRRICISVNLDANVAASYLRSNSRQRGLAGCINLRDSARSLFHILRLFLRRAILFIHIDLRRGIFSFSLRLLASRGREDNNPRLTNTESNNLRIYAGYDNLLSKKKNIPPSQQN